MLSPLSADEHKAYADGFELMLYVVKPLLADEVLRLCPSSCAKTEGHRSHHPALCSLFLQESNQFPGDQGQPSSPSHARVSREKKLFLFKGKDDL